MRCVGCGKDFWGCACDECISRHLVVLCRGCRRYTKNIDIKFCEDCAPLQKLIPQMTCRKCKRTVPVVDHVTDINGLLWSNPTFVPNQTGLVSWWWTLPEFLDICIPCYAKEHSETYKCFFCEGEFPLVYQWTTYKGEPRKTYSDEELKDCEEDYWAANKYRHAVIRYCRHCERIRMGYYGDNHVYHKHNPKSPFDWGEIGNIIRRPTEYQM